MTEMSFLENVDIKEIQTKIKHHIDELEEKVKNSKIYWNHCEVKFDKDFVQNFIEGHYSEIVHHLNEIKHHLEQINHHQKELAGIQQHLTTPQEQEEESTQNSPEFPKEPDLNQEQKEAVVKRPQEDKCRFITRRASKSSSLKYVLQWEKMLGEQKEYNPLNSIKRRTKNGPEEENEEADVPKIMVKNRVLQFEGFQKPKRVSSTIETFLDFSEEKPKRIRSYPILEEIEDEDEFERPEERERPRSCELGRSCEDSLSSSDTEPVAHSENPQNESGGFGDGFTVKELSNIQEDDEGDQQNIQTNQLVTEKPIEELSIGDAKDEHAQNVKQDPINSSLEREKKEMETKKLPCKQNTDDLLNEKEDGESQDCRKPRIVEIHYKQQ